MKTRDNTIYKINYGKSGRYKKSAILSIHRLLNMPVLGSIVEIINLLSLFIISIIIIILT